MTYQTESESESCLVMSDSLRPHGLYSPWNSPGQNTGVGSLSLLQGSSQPMYQTQVSRIAGRFFTSWATRKAQYHRCRIHTGFWRLSTKKIVEWSEVKDAQSHLTLCDPMDYTVHGTLQARVLEWVTFPFSRGSSWPRNQNGVSCIAGGFFTNWAMREAYMTNTYICYNCC